MLDAQSLQRQPLTHTKKLGNRQMTVYLKSQVDIANTLFSIEKYLEQHPTFYLHSLLHSLKGQPLDYIKSRLEQEYKDLLSGCSFYHRIHASIEARNKCINKIKRDLTRAQKFLNLFPKAYFGQTQADQAYTDWVEGEGYSVVEIDESIEHSIRVLSGIFVDMSRLRDMTIYIVETVHSWRVELEDHLDRCQQHTPIHYYFQGKQLYETILEDTNFIWVSKLSDYIWLQAKQDPFLMRNLIYIQERKEKTILEKYFVELMTPKNPQIVDKALKCLQMLGFKYQPKLSNRFEEEELLIQNYLSLQREKRTFDEPNQDEQTSDKRRQQGQESRGKEENAGSPEEGKKKGKLSGRGWVFEKGIKQPTRERVKEVIERQRDKLHLRPYNITNDTHKQSIVMAYLSQVQKKEKRHPKVTRPRVLSSSESTHQRQFFSENQDASPQVGRRERQVESEPEPLIRSSKLFRSLTKLGPVIYEDPKQYAPDTPTNQKRKQKQFTDLNGPKSKIKINSFVNNPAERQTDTIEIDQEQTPLNIKKFYEVFRADTTRARPMAHSTVKLPKTEEKLVSIKEFLDRARKDRAKSIPYGRKTAIPLMVKRRQRAPRRSQKSRSKSKSLEKSRTSYKGYTVIDKSRSPPKQKDINISESKVNNAGEYIHLKAKSIPFDLIIPYVRHIIANQHSTSRSFSAYQADIIINRLADPFLHSIIFDIHNQNNQQMGQIILSQSLSGKGKLKYTVEFLNMHTFEAIINSLLRVSEELLATTPCQEVVCPFVVDKLDLVSSHFIENLDRGLNDKIGQFGRLSILQRNKSGGSGDVRQRLYILTSEASLKRQYDLGVKMMSCYRSLRIECKCFVLTSNFRLKSAEAFHNTLHSYRTTAIGQLFVRVLGKILTKYHLKQLKQASYSLDTTNQLANLLKNDTFIRNIISALSNQLQTAQNQEEESKEIIKVTGFNTIDDLLNYMHYKGYDKLFVFKFLEKTRFMPNHQLILAELDQEVSLEFTLTSNQLLYTLHNHKRMPILQLTSHCLDSEAFLLPTTHQTLQLLMMPADEFKERTNQSLDLYSYFSLFFRNLRSEECLNETPSVILPNLSHKRTAVSQVRMYDGLFRLFPERQFYSGAIMTCLNHWQGYYLDAVVHIAKEGSLMFNYPFFMGLYDSRTKQLASLFLYEREE